MIRLVINADDLGLHPKIDEGIFQAADAGVLTSATVLVTGRTAPTAVEQAKVHGLGLGVQLALTSHLNPAAPPRDVRWLAPGGRFRANWAEFAAAWLGRLVPTEEVELELRAQVQRARELGMHVDHLDTHQHLALLPGMTALVEKLAVELNLPMRWPVVRPRLRWLAHPRSTAKTLLLNTLGAAKGAPQARRIQSYGVHESGRLTETRLLRIIRTLPQGEFEILAHPGFHPGVVPEDPTWRYDWEAELAALTSPAVRDALAEQQIELCRFSDFTA